MTPVVNFNGGLPEWADYDIQAIYVLIAKFVMLNIKLSSMDPSPTCRNDRRYPRGMAHQRLKKLIMTSVKHI